MTEINTSNINSDAMASGCRYTINDFNDIAKNGFEYRISENTLDIISALASQVGAPDYIKTPNFNSENNMRYGNHQHKHITKNNGYNNGFDDENGSREYRGRNGHGRRRRKAQEMSDDDWEDLRTFQAKPKAELTPEKIMEKKLRGELNRVVSGCSRSQIMSIVEVMNEMIEADMNSVVENVFFEIATCSKINTGLFAELFCELVDADEDISEFLNEALGRFIQSGVEDKHNKWGWMNKYGEVEYINEDQDYDRFCDVNKVNDKRLNVSRFIGRLFQMMFEKEDSRFMWLEQLAGCYLQMYNGFISVLEKENCEDVAMIYCANIIEFMDPIIDYIEDLDSSYELWHNVNEVMNEIIDDGQETYPSLSRQIIFALQASNIV